MNTETQNTNQHTYNTHSVIINTPNSIVINETIITEKYNEIKNENIILNSKIENQNVIINELKEDNRLLKEDNRLLKEDNKLLNKKIDDQNIIINNQNIIINELREENKILKNKINKMENNIMHKKYLYAIQDLNSIELLEKKLPCASSLIKLKQERINDAHYINDYDNNILIDQKIYVLHEKLINMPTEIKDKFNKRYPNVLNDILKFTDINVNITSDEYDDINEWWDS
jgi:hypothetical protein